jgi:hypothetical protein
MPFPSPTSPTLNDLWYNALNSGGSLNTTAFVLPLFISMQQAVATTENMVFNFALGTSAADTSDFIGTAENVQVAVENPGPQQFSIVLGQPHQTFENVIVTAPFNPSNTKVVTVNDATVTADPAVVLEA